MRRTSAEWLAESQARNAARAQLPAVFHTRPPVCGGDVWRAPCGVDLMDLDAPDARHLPSYGEPVTCPRCLEIADLKRGEEHDYSERTKEWA